MAEFVLTPQVKALALRSMGDLRGETVFIVNKETSKPIRMGPGGKVTANGGLGPHARWRVRRGDRPHRLGPVVRFENVATGKFLAIKNGNLTQGGGGEHCEFIVEMAQMAVFLKKHNNPGARIGFNANGQPVPANSLGNGDRGRHFIFDCDQVTGGGGGRAAAQAQAQAAHAQAVANQQAQAAAQAQAQAQAAAAALAAANAQAQAAAALAQAAQAQAAQATAVPAIPAAVAVPVQPVTAYRTPPNADGGGSTIFLDRHHVKVPHGHVLVGFHLKRPSGNQIGYEFYGTPSRSRQPEMATNTPPNDEGNGNLIYLDRHEVMAPGNALLTGFKLHRVGGGRYQIDFTFQPNAGHGPVTQQQTPTNADGGGKHHTIFLDRHKVIAPQGFGLKGFRVVRPNDRSIAIRFWTQRLR